MSSKIVLAAFATVLLGALSAQAAPTARVASLTVGAPGKPQATFLFEGTPKPGRIRLTTSLAGVAGSRFALYVDGAASPVFDHVFSADECRFVDDGSRSQCRLTIAGSTPAYRLIRESVKRGKTARITIEDAGVMKMDSTAALTALRGRLR
jgi:hypothetical protein